MFNRLKKLYEQERVTKEMLRIAVNKHWITESEFKEITGEDF